MQRDRAAGVTERYTSTPDPLAEEKADGRVVKLTGPGSLLAIGQRLEELERPKAAERQAEGRRRGGEVFAGREASASMDAQAPVRVDMTVADALGISAAT